jgi:hypothetical protein
MADPVSIAGTAIGVVSLGLSLCQGLTQYLQALRCRREDIDSTSCQIDCLQSAFVVIKDALANLSSDHQSARDVQCSQTDQHNGTGGRYRWYATNTSVGSVGSAVAMVRQRTVRNYVP